MPESKENLGLVDFKQLDEDPTAEFLLISYQELPGDRGRSCIHALKTAQGTGGIRLIEVLLNNALNTGQHEDVLELITAAEAILRSARESIEYQIRYRSKHN
jgi:hypothetical protein